MRRSVYVSLTFLFFLITSLIGAFYARSVIKEYDQEAFVQSTNHISRIIEHDFFTLEQLLRDSAAFYSASNSVSREEFKVYLESTKIKDYLSGIVAIGFSAWIKDSEGSNKTTSDKRGAIYVSSRGSYTSVVYIESQEGSTNNIIGYDMFSQPALRGAMERARDTGLVAVSKKHRMNYESQDDAEDMHVFYMPIYSKYKRPMTVTERRESLVGFVFIPVKILDFIEHIKQDIYTDVTFVFDEKAVDKKYLHVDSVNSKANNFLLEKTQFNTTKILDFAGQQWVMQFSTIESSVPFKNHLLPTFVIIAGLLISILLTIITWLLLAARQRVKKIVSELKKQEVVNGVLLENLAEGVIACDENLKLTIYNLKIREWFSSGSLNVPIEKWSSCFNLYEDDGVTLLATEKIPIVRAQNGESFNNMSLCVVAKGKKAQYLLASGGPIVDSKNFKVGAIVVIRDVTERQNIANRGSSGIPSKCPGIGYSPLNSGSTELDTDRTVHY
jgi:CHASE1-domain containing sensor protein